MTTDALARRSFALALFALLLTLAATARAQGETWIPAPPESAVPLQLAAFDCAGQAGVNARWLFSDSGYRVVQTPLVSREGQTVTLDARVERWTGGVLPAFFTLDKNFDIGLLEPGTYTLVFKSWGATLKQIQFTVRQTPTPAQPIDAGCFFVTQHYRDFLSREPDGSGFSFWTGEIEQCGTDPSCVDLKRINVSAAFFLSIEFHETGYYVYRIYKAALGRRPTFAEFVPAAAFVGHGVVVGSNDPWPIRLGGNKDNFAQGFVGRQDFVARYGGLTNEQYVDKLFQTAGLTPTQAERDELVNGLNRDFNNCFFSVGCTTRASVLRKVAERADFDRKVFDEAFVTMQYFGYLRRDPDEDGFNFWLTKLDRFNGDFNAAEMVKAFISSDEYRQRFGS